MLADSIARKRRTGQPANLIGEGGLINSYFHIVSCYPNGEALHSPGGQLFSMA